MSLAVKALNDRIETLSKYISMEKEGAEHSRKMLRTEETNVATAQAEISELMESVKKLEIPKGPEEPPTMVHLDPMMWDALFHMIPDKDIFHPIPSPLYSAMHTIELRTPINRKIWFIKDRLYAGEPVDEPANKFGFEKAFAKERAREQTVASVDQQLGMGVSCDESGPVKPQEKSRPATICESLQAEYDKAKRSMEKCAAEAGNYQAHIHAHDIQRMQYEEMAMEARKDMERLSKAMQILGYEVR